MPQFGILPIFSEEAREAMRRFVEQVEEQKRLKKAKARQQAADDKKQQKA